MPDVTSALTVNSLLILSLRYYILLIQCQVAAWSSHKSDCHNKKNSSKQKEEKKKKKATSSRKDKAGAKLNRNEAKEMIDDLKNAHASYGRE